MHGVRASPSMTRAVPGEPRWRCSTWGINIYSIDHCVRASATPPSKLEDLVAVQNDHLRLSLANALHGQDISHIDTFHKCTVAFA